MKSFIFFKQLERKDCGATCLRMIAKYYGCSVGIQNIGVLTETTRSGSTLKNIANAAEKIGFRTLGVKIDFEKLKEDAPLPLIAHWRQDHFVVVYEIKTKRKKTTIKVADPAHGLLQYTQEEFITNWISPTATNTTKEGIALLLEPTPKLNQTEDDDQETSKGFSFLFQYLFRYKKFIVQLVIGLIAGSLLQLVFPFLTQSVVDIGIQNQDINFIYLILIAQLLLFAGRTSIELIRGWILLHLSTKINIFLVSDFFIKLMNISNSKRQQLFDKNEIGKWLNQFVQ